MIGILGGTFDPIHIGHLCCAMDVYAELGLKSLHIMPCAVPPHREKPIASAQQRLEMLKLGVAGVPEFYVDNRELNRPGPSYTIDTLVTLRQEYPNSPLVLLMGTDAFSSLPTWYHWEEIIENAHIVVMNRLGHPAEYIAELEELISRRQVKTVDEMQTQLSGCIYFCRVTFLDISASKIRMRILNDISARFLVTEKVWDYILRHKLYSS